MRRLILATIFLVGFAPTTVPAQDWRGHAALGLAGGYQTNLYLDPVLGTWTPDAKSALLAFTPQLGVSRIGRRTRLDITVRSHLHPRRTERPKLLQGTLRLRRQLSPNWTLGGTAGGTRYRYPALADGIRTARDSWWALPSLRWTPTSRTMLTLRTGLTQRFEHLPSATDRQTSGLATLRATHWLTDRFQGGVRLHYTSGRTSAAETQFGGAGGSANLTYWPTSSVSVRGTVGAEQLRYETVDSSTVRDRLGQAALKAEWTPRSSVTVFGRAGAARATFASDASPDVHLSIGVRLSTQGVPGGSPETSSPQRVCQNTEDGLRIRVPYDGEGTLHVTGDFNNWSLPGVPLHSTENGWETTLDLPASRYAYRLRVVDGDEARWLDLPSYARTVESAFGDTNGVCTVQ
ncbi:MAG: hypothetical protein BRD55_07010 [Bacteroidetes bacterium SW_9_63_38]|nr:MAG: hypothetical protein BRD55_07010 [Bacteroidetes bacterium SW_9_63_38]